MGIIAKLFGNKQTDALLNKIDIVVDRIPSVQVNPEIDNLAGRALNDLISIQGDNKESKANLDEIEKLLEGISIPEDRIKRYEAYDDVYKSIQLVKRIIKTYINCIFQKDTITNTTFIIKENEEFKNYDHLEEIKKFVKSILNFFSLEDKLRYNIAFNMLKYGDSFIELVHLDEVTTNFPEVDKKKAKKTNDDSIITEFHHHLFSKNGYRNDFALKNLDSFVDCLVEFDSAVNIEDFEQEINESTFDPNLIDLSKYNLKKILLKIHKPHRIIPLLSPYDNILGYIEIKQVERSTSSINVLKQFTEVIDKIGGKSQGGKDKYDTVLRDLSKLIIKKTLQNYNIVKQSGTTSQEYENKIKETLDEDLYYSLKRILAVFDNESLFRKKLNIRFIKPNNMFQFSAPGSDYYPLGSSILDPLLFPAKLYLFTQLSNVVYKLSRASLVRKWIVNFSDIIKRFMIENFENSVKV